MRGVMVKSVGKSGKNRKFLLVRPSLSKRGQFYLVTAVVLAAVIIGISAISNYSKKEKSPGLEELKEEIRIESEKTLDYGVNNGFNSTQIYWLMQNFTNYYVNYEGRNGKDIYFIFGNANNITVSGYQEEDKTISVSSGSSQATITQTKGSFTGGIDPAGTNVAISIDGDAYSFNLSAAENFYFIIAQNTGGGE